MTFSRLIFLRSGMVLAWLWVLCASVNADEVVDLYQAEPLVASQSRAERNDAMSDALAEVLVRASGKPEILRNPDVVRALGDANNYLVQYSYASSDETLTIDDRDVPAQRLQLRFSADAVTNLLRDLQLPLWPANRPSTLVWLVADEVTEGRRLVSPQSHPDVVDALQAMARQRGLPLVTPLMDLDDQVALPVNSLWSLDEETIEKASERYQADSIFVGRLSETSRRRWRGSWYLEHRGKTQVFESRGADAAEAVSGGLAQLADYYVSLYGITPGSGPSEALTFQINGVTDFAAYSNVLDYLNNLAVIRRADLAAVRGESLLLHLYPEGDLTLVQDALALDGRLVPQQRRQQPPSQPGGSLGPAGSQTTPQLPATEGSPENPLQYRWQ